MGLTQCLPNFENVLPPLVHGTAPASIAILVDIDPTECVWFWFFFWEPKIENVHMNQNELVQSTVDERTLSPHSYMPESPAIKNGQCLHHLKAHWCLREHLVSNRVLLLRFVCNAQFHFSHHGCIEINILSIYLPIYVTVCRANTVRSAA